MKKLILGVAALLFAAQVSFAQNETAAKAQEKTKALTEKLSLTADQQGAINSIFVEHVAAKKAIKEDSSLDAATSATRIAELNTNLDSRVNGVLNDEQKAQYAQYIAEKRQKKNE